MIPALLAALGIAAVIGLVIGIVVVSKRIERKRTEAMQLVADELGLTFHPAGDSQVTDAIAHFQLFNQGHSRKTVNLLFGQSDDIELSVFGYRYVVGGGQHQSMVSQTVMGFCSPTLSVPDFHMRPENIFHKFTQALGYGDIDFDSHPVFSKSFNLKGPDEQAVRDFFSAEILEAFERREGVSVEASGNKMIYYRGGKRLRPEQIRGFMEDGFEIYRLFAAES